MRCSRCLVSTVVVAAVVTVAAAPAAPAATPEQYVAKVRKSYLPFRAAWLAKTTPCQQRAYASCRARLVAAQRTAIVLQRTLAAKGPPARVIQAHRMLLRGIREVRGYLAKSIPAWTAGDDARIDKVGCSCLVGADITNAITELNALVPGANLPELG